LVERISPAADLLHFIRKSRPSHGTFFHLKR
jgi:hypothetical protein